MKRKDVETSALDIGNCHYVILYTEAAATSECLQMLTIKDKRKSCDRQIYQTIRYY